MSVSTVSAAGDEKMLRSIIEKLWIRVHLYVNDRRPRYNDRREDYIELDGHGYAPIELRPDDWRVGRDGRRRLFAEGRAAIWVFEVGNPQRVYGYFVTDQATQDWLWADRLVADEPIVLQNTGERLRVIIRLPSFVRRQG